MPDLPDEIAAEETLAAAAEPDDLVDAEILDEPTPEEERAHLIEQADAVSSLGMHISSANAGLAYARAVLQDLIGGRLHAVDYAMGTVGADIEHHLQDAMRALRAAHALHRSVAGHYRHPDLPPRDDDAQVAFDALASRMLIIAKNWAGVGSVEIDRVSKVYRAHAELIREAVHTPAGADL